MKALASVVCGVVIAAAAPAIADPVKCSDGTTDASGSGACAHHGGVVERHAKPRAERPRATKGSQARTMTMRMRSRDGVLCNDGTRATSPKTCVHHDGVAGAISIERLDSNGTQVSGGTTTDFGPGVRCADGSRSLVVGKDACSDRGGVVGAKASEPRLDSGAAARRTQSRPRRTRSMHPEGSVLCSDGTMSAQREGCAQHGGAAEGADAFEHHDGPIRARPSGSGSELCADDTTADAGACANHGGEVKQRPADRGGTNEAGVPVAVCKDGQIARRDHAGGVCSYHGGVSRWL
jgi:hypothetical protein